MVKRDGKVEGRQKSDKKKKGEGRRKEGEEENKRAEEKVFGGISNKASAPLPTKKCSFGILT